MCAIIGASAEEGLTVDVEDLKVLYLMAENRGGHACGFTNGKKLIKSADTSYDFVAQQVAKKDFPTDNTSFIGHTRYATIGNRNKGENAHPFNKTKVIGVHNGSIYNHADLKKLTRSKAEVDSEILYEMINDYGLLKTLPLLQGLLALSFYNKENGNIYIYRKNRPLSYGYKTYYDEKASKVRRILFWGSLPSYLEAIGCEDIKSFAEHKIYTIKNGVIFRQRQVKKVLTPEPPAITYYGHNKYESKDPSLDIFKDRIKYIRDLKLSYESELFKKPEPVTQKPIKTNDNSEMPMNAYGFVSLVHGHLFYWFDSNIPHHINLFSTKYDITEQYDLSSTDDLELLSKQYGEEESDIVPHINYNYKELRETYDIRMEIFNEENTKVF